MGCNQTGIKLGKANRGWALQDKIRQDRTLQNLTGNDGMGRNETGIKLGKAIRGWTLWDI